MEAQSDQFGFTWPGKAAARRLAAAPCNAALVPAPAESFAAANTANLFVEGDNLAALKLLAPDYREQVRLIYIDPPYNTGNVFAYSDNFAARRDAYLRANGGVADGRQHAQWLSMMFPRLLLARDLLRSDGVIFVSIDDHEVHHLRMLLDEVFGAEQFLATIIWEKVYSPRMDAAGFSISHDYILVYGKSRAAHLDRVAFVQNKRQFSFFDPVRNRFYRRRSLRKEGKDSLRADVPAMYFALPAPDGSPVYPVKPDGTAGRWRWSRRKYDHEAALGNVEWVQVAGSWQVYVKQYYRDAATRPPETLWRHNDVGHNHEAQQELAELCGPRVFETPKPTRLIRRILEIATRPDRQDIVLDFFAGSCSTAQAVLEQNHADGGDRRFIMVQLPAPNPDPRYPTIAAIGKARIAAVLRRLTALTPAQPRATPADHGLRVLHIQSPEVLDDA